MSDEAWKPVVGWEDRYWVSSWGRVWSMYSQRFLKTPRGAQGYPVVTLRASGRYRHTTVHVIELEAFAGPCPPGMETRHLNDVKTDNRWPENLCWGTLPENHADRLANGFGNRGERHPLHRLTEEAVLAVYSRRHEPAAQLAAEFGVSRQCISHVTSGRRWGWLTGSDQVPCTTGPGR